MTPDRLAAFSDGVIAVIITIMVLELHVPHGADWAALATVAPVFASYVLSFVCVAIYWNNHHHLLHTVERVDHPTLFMPARLGILQRAIIRLQGSGSHLASALDRDGTGAAHPLSSIASKIVALMSCPSNACPTSS